jgi:hypothetical protein
MQTTKTAERVAGGMDQRHLPQDNQASLVVNMRVDDEGLGWVRDRGWEPYDPKAGYTHVQDIGLDPIYSLHVFTSKKGSQTAALFEQGGELLYIHGIDDNSGDTFPIREVIDTGRALPKSDDPGTQYVPHNDFLLILNGYNTPLKYRGNKYVVPFSFDKRPSAPAIFAPDPTYYSVAGAGAQRNDSGSVSTSLTHPEGLGNTNLSTDGSETNRYFYKVAYLTDTGSLSPLSEASSAAWVFDSAAEAKRYAVLLRNLPIGPTNVVGRVIYRTKNCRFLDTAEQAIYYFLAKIDDNTTTDFMDIRPDSELVEEAPSLTASTLFPQTLKYAASWDGRIWATGGAGYEGRVIYSERGAPEQFGTFNFFDVGVSAGGQTTGVFSYHDALLIFRERSVTYITYASDGSSYRLGTLSPDIGTTAINSVALIPGKGLMFLTPDGVYLISGSGNSLSMTRVSERVSRELKRVSKGSLARASAAWSPREREWWCHYPADGETTCTRGVVYHADIGDWSLRHATASSGVGAFQFNAIRTLPAGYFLLAPQTVRQTGPDKAFNVGLQVWTAKAVEGEEWELSSLIEGGWNITKTVIANNITGVYESAWEDFGTDASVSSARYVMVDVLTRGHLPLTLEYAVDWKEKYTSAGTQAAAVSAYYGGASEEAVYGPSTETVDRVAIIGTDSYSSEKVTRLRWDVAPSAHSWFKFRLSAQSRFTVVRYKLGYIPKEREVLKQRT